MALSTAGINLMLDALGASGGFLSLHSADPGATGANETTAARKAATWAAAAAKVKALTGSYAFTGVAANGPVTWFGIWTAATGGTFLGGYVIPAGGTNDQAANAAGAYTLDSASITGA